MTIVRATAIIAALLATGICAVSAAAQEAQAKPDGAALFKEHCSMCHVSGGAKGSQRPRPRCWGRRRRRRFCARSSRGQW